jgi:hypothetical protein
LNFIAFADASIFQKPFLTPVHKKAAFSDDFLTGSAVPVTPFSRGVFRRRQA